MPSETPLNVKPYISFGVDLGWKPGDKQANGDCPFCGAEGKFTVQASNGVWRCWSCGEGNEKGAGNLTVFLRCLWKRSKSTTRDQDYTQLANTRKPIFPSTLKTWGVVRSLINGCWLIPGYGVENINQLYRWQYTKKGYRVLATGTLEHQLFGRNLYKPKKPFLYLCEGPWDAMTFWQMLRQVRYTGKQYIKTTDPKKSLLTISNVLAVPGCMVFRKQWVKLFSGKTVCILFDNDIPRKNPKTGKLIKPAASQGISRVASMLFGDSNPPKDIMQIDYKSFYQAIKAGH